MVEKPSVNPEEKENKKIVYNKLVRDKIPQIISADGATSETRTIEDEKEFDSQLLIKLSEEMDELKCATTKHEQLKEMADIMEVLRYLPNLSTEPNLVQAKELIKEYQALNNFTDEQIEQKRTERNSQRGGFDRRIFLISTEGGNY